MNAVVLTRASRRDTTLRKRARAEMPHAARRGPVELDRNHVVKNSAAASPSSVDAAPADSELP